MIGKGLENINSSHTKSPCVRNCCLNKDDVCLGCFRHIEEIVGWKGLSDDGKVKVLECCETRKVEMKQAAGTYTY